MSLILTESWESQIGYQNQQNNGTPYIEYTSAGKWYYASGGTASAYVTSGAARHGSYGVQVNNSVNYNSRYNHQVRPDQEHATFIYGFARYYNTAPTNLQYHTLARFLSDGGGTMHVTVYYDSVNSRFIVSRGDGIFGSGTLIYQGPNGQWVMDQNWHYFEMKCTLDAVNGYFELHIDGQPMFSASALNTKNGGTKNTFDTIQMVLHDYYAHTDDIYLCNAAGAVNNDFLGDVIIEYLAPNGNGAFSNGWGSDSNQVDNYQLVRGYNDNDYVDLINTGDADSYLLQDSGYGVPYTPAGMIVYARVDKTDAGPRHVQITARENGVQVNSVDKTPGWGSYTYFHHVLETRPSDGSPWTFADVNATEIGVVAT